MAKGKQLKGTEEIIPEGAPEPEPTVPAPEELGLEQKGITKEQLERPQFRATGAAQGQGVTHFEKLALGDESLKFQTEAELAKYNEDVRTINNMQLEDPIRFQAEHGYFPRRGDTSIDKRGLTAQDQDDVITAKKRLEGPDDQGNYKAVLVN